MILLTKSFVPDSILGKEFTNSSHHIISTKKDHNGDLWILVETDKGKELGKAVKQRDGNIIGIPTRYLEDLT